MAALTMATETEKARALLQTFSTASIIASTGLGMFCFFADRFLEFSFIQHNDWLRALSDNAVHGVVGLWSWAIVIGIRKKSDFCEVIFAGFLASVIDLDHFYLAGSLSLKRFSVRIGLGYIAPFKTQDELQLYCRFFALPSENKNISTDNNKIRRPYRLRRNEKVQTSTENQLVSIISQQ
ncbi:Transmembrane protein C5orf28-like [Acipenser ruthenus]|uniref:Transmembrane protein 267 n=1 Tax=Acipenser ruthenus TaxID=7906 RepID=A0A444URM4_ACIRT|nr:Transmembrane protein C5orf28-like [Acipenser ruthenus]